MHSQQILAKRWLLNLIVFFGIAFIETAVTCGQQKPGPTDLSVNDPQSVRWLMLHNGAVFSGVVGLEKHRYTVQVDSRTKMQFDNVQVAVIADQLSELYEYRRTRLSAADLTGRMTLVRWCLMNGLLAEAEAEIAVLQARGVPPTQLRSLELALQNERSRHLLQEAKAQAPLTEQPTSPSSSPETLRSPMASGAALALHPRLPIPIKEPAIQRLPDLSSDTLASRPPETNTSDSGEERKQPVVNSVFSFFDQPGFQNSETIQEVIDNSPPQESVSLFSDRVHWTLVQACAGCHYPENQRLVQQSGLSLEIPSAPHKATLQQLRHNYDQFVALVSRENPGNSRLVGLLTDPHGPMREPPITLGSEDFNAVMNWIYKSGARPAMPADRSRVVTASAETDQIATDLREAAASLLPHKNAKENAKEGVFPGPLSWKPQVNERRPYDPDAFNRHYHPQGRSTTVQENTRAWQPPPSSEENRPLPTVTPSFTPAESTGANLPESAEQNNVAPPAGIPRLKLPSAGSPPEGALQPSTRPS